MQRTREAVSEGLLPDEREVLILERLRLNGRVIAAELAAEFRTSEHTVRRHLRDLAEAGHCKRVYGGAVLVAAADPRASTRMNQSVGRKQRLGVAAATIVRTGQVILLDAGTTNAAIADALPDDANLTVITNSPDVCTRLIDRPGFDVILIGGRVTPRGAGSTGATALLQVQQVKADLCFLGACSFDIAEGVAAFDAEEAELKRAMVKAAGQLAVAVTSEKLMTSGPFLVAPASAIDYLIVEADLASDRIAALTGACTHLVVATS